MKDWRGVHGPELRRLCHDDARKIRERETATLRGIMLGSSGMDPDIDMSPYITPTSTVPTHDHPQVGHVTFTPNEPPRLHPDDIAEIAKQVAEELARRGR